VWALPMAHQKIGLGELARKGGVMERIINAAGA
jgi:hypothetical protein